MAGSFLSSAPRRVPARPVTRPSAASGILPHPNPGPGAGGVQPGFIQRPPGLANPPTPSWVQQAAAQQPAGQPLTTTHTTTVTPKPPDLSGSQYLAYLTPDQLNALNQAGYQYNQGVGDQNANMGNAQAGYQVQSAQAQHEHDVNQEQANESLAARGLFSSSIRANDLTDINRVLAEKQAAATATLNTLVGEAQRAIIGMNNSWGSTQTMYQGLAAGQAAQLPQFQPHQVTEQVPIQPPTAPQALSPQQVAYINAGTGNHGATNPPPGHGRVSDPFARSGGFKSSPPRRVR